MTTQTIERDLLDAIESSRPWQGVLERMRALRRLPDRKPGGYALHETIAAARSPLYASMHRSLGGTLFVAVATPDAAERSFADLLYYLSDRSDRLALLRSREEAVGAIESPSERGATHRAGADRRVASAVHAARRIRRLALHTARRRRNRFRNAATASLRSRVRAQRRRQRRRRICGARRDHRSLRRHSGRAGAHRVLRRRDRVDARLRYRVATQQHDGRDRRRCPVERPPRRQCEYLRLSPRRRDGGTRRAGEHRGGRESARRRARERAAYAARGRR